MYMYTVWTNNKKPKKQKAEKKFTTPKGATI